MKKIILAIFLLASSLYAQTAALSGYCDLGASQALTSGLSSSNYQQGLIPSCTVTVYLTGTTTLATIYSDSSSTPLSNPFTANADASWLLYASVDQGYDIVLSGGTSPNVYITPVTLTGIYATSNVTINIPFYNVEAYGAKCDGTTDDVAAIQSALKAAVASGGMVLIPGVCAIASPIILPTTASSSDLPYGITGNWGGEIVALSSFTNAHAMIYRQYTTNGPSNFILTSITLNGNSIATAATNIEYQRNVTVENVNISGLVPTASGSDMYFGSSSTPSATAASYSSTGSVITITSGAHTFLAGDQGTISVSSSGDALYALNGTSFTVLSSDLGTTTFSFSSTAISSGSGSTAAVFTLNSTGYVGLHMKHLQIDNTASMAVSVSNRPLCGIYGYQNAYDMKFDDVTVNFVSQAGICVVGGSVELNQIHTWGYSAISSNIYAGSWPSYAIWLGSHSYNTKISNIYSDTVSASPIYTAAGYLMATNIENLCNDGGTGITCGVYLVTAASGATNIQVSGGIQGGNTLGSGTPINWLGTIDYLRSRTSSQWLGDQTGPHQAYSYTVKNANGSWEWNVNSDASMSITDGSTSNKVISVASGAPIGSIAVSVAGAVTTESTLTSNGYVAASGSGTQFLSATSTNSTTYPYVEAKNATNGWKFYPIGSTGNFGLVDESTNNVLVTLYKGATTTLAQDSSGYWNFSGRVAANNGLSVGSSGQSISDLTALPLYCGNAAFSASTTSAALSCTWVTTSSHCLATWASSTVTGGALGYTASAGSVTLTAQTSNSGTATVWCRSN